MARYKVILAYDGTEFLGFQRQKKSSSQGLIRTVQGEVEKALQKVGWQGDSILSAGRTDTGVHASGQVIAFDMEWNHSVEALRNALNSAFPSDIAAKHIQLAAESFHPRYDALQRKYEYRLLCQPYPDPLRERYAWRVWPTVDPIRMNTAAVDLIGDHDFAAFGRPLKPEGSTIRRVISAEWVVDASEQTTDGEAYRFLFTANAFLYHMVRRTVQLLVLIGQGREYPDQVLTHLNAPGSSDEVRMIQGMAPPQGLRLSEVVYPVSEDLE
ncbi:MAG: tRNA pseudouridine(38-40) synthase TruA [Anaerolineales bacterium]|nr:tRNA pseudouridine(38-40) synthase TruA [Anaerolineales bacterium]